MDQKRAHKYKDALPIDTVKRIRDILYGLGISTVDRWIDSGVARCHSLRVELAPTDLGTNGKGTTPDFALASAYAELMERIQNDLLYVLDHSERARRHCGFTYAPDERCFSVEELAGMDSPWIDVLSSELTEESAVDPLAFLEPAGSKEPAGGEEGEGRAQLAQRRAKRRAIESWRFLTPAGFDGDGLISLPFYSAKDRCLYHMPFSILRSTYGSNGTCAGNTPEEALVQGLSEVFERHVNARIVRDRLTPPTVPDEHLRKYPELHAVIGDIEARGPYRLRIKDCSLGLGYPVLASVLTDLGNQTYKVKFGSHPSFAIALERCLTELFQGTPLEIASQTNRFSYGESLLGEQLNIHNLMRMAVGHYPPSFFSDSSNWPFTPFPDVEAKDNGALFRSLAAVLLEQGYDVLVRDVSFLGFPSFQVVVPGFSELYTYDALKIRENRSRDTVRGVMRNLHAASAEDLKKLVLFVRFTMASLMENTVPYLYGSPLKLPFEGGHAALNVLLVLAYYRLGMLDEAREAARSVLSYLPSDQGEEEREKARYYRCLTDYLAARKDGRSEPDIRAILGKVYPRGALDRVIDDFGDPSRVFDRFYPRVTCWSCERCPVRRQCDYPYVEQIHKRLKERYGNNPQDQMRNARFFEAP